METRNGIPAFHARSRAEWREWLTLNCQTQQSIWLIIYHKKSGIPSVYYPEALDEALCFGWIDSKINKRDDQSYYQFFAKRNPKSNWSKVNKEKVVLLIQQGLMTKMGLEMVELAKQTGTWVALDEVEQLLLPPEMTAMFESQPDAAQNWEQFPRSVKRGILEWIANAKREETRQKRIAETVSLAAQNRRANQYRQ